MSIKGPGRSQRVHLKDINLTSLGWELVLPIVAGLLIGNQISKHLAGQHYPLIVGILVGIGIGYYNLYRHIELEVLRLKVNHLHEHEKEPSP